MRAGIHPVYKATKIVCVCGNVIETRSTHDKDELHVEICANCHPCFTGKQKLLDKAGRVERFRKRYAASDKGKAAAASDKTKADAAAAETTSS